LQSLCKEQGKRVNANDFFARKEQLAANSIKLVEEIYPVAQVFAFFFYLLSSDPVAQVLS
jgi:hypothetical protein